MLIKTKIVTIIYAKIITYPRLETAFTPLYPDSSDLFWLRCKTDVFL